MRLTTSNPLPYQPKTPLESKLCQMVVADSGEVVLDVWTPNTYPFEDLNGNRVVLKADFEVRTGLLTNGLFLSGSIYHGILRDGKLEVALEGGWR